jgi:hypothetical protein
MFQGICTQQNVIGTCQPQIWYVPIYDYACTSSNGCDVPTVCGNNKPSGSNGCYHFSGFAGFVATGASLNGGGGGGVNQGSYINGDSYCQKNSNECVYGYFVGPEVGKFPTSQGGGQDFGVSSFSLSG